VSPPRRSHPEAKLSRDPRADVIRAPLAPFYETIPTPVPESPRLPSVPPPAIQKSPNERLLGWLVERIGTLVDDHNAMGRDVAVHATRLDDMKASLARLTAHHDEARESIVEDLQEQIASTTREATWRRRLLITTLISAIGWAVSFYLGTLVHQ